MQQDIEAFQQEKFGQPNGEYFIRQEQLISPIREKIMNAIEVIKNEEGYHFVFDKSNDLFLLYADPKFDITYRVLDKLKRGG